MAQVVRETRQAVNTTRWRAALSQHCWFSWLLRLLGTLAITAWLLMQLNLREWQRVVVTPALLPLLGMVGAAWLFVLLGGFKFWVLYRALTPVAWRPFLGYFVVATSVGAFTPASVGDFSLVALLRRERIPVHTSLSVMVLDRVLTMSIYAVVFLPLTLGLVFHIDSWWLMPASVLLGITLLLTLHTIAVVLQRGSALLARWRLSWLTASLLMTSTLIRQYPWHLLGNIGLTCVRCVMAGVTVQLALWAAGEWQPFLPVLYTTNTLSLLNLLPVSLGGLGVYEGGGVALLGQLGFDRDRVFAALVYQRFYVLLYALLVLVLWRVMVLVWPRPERSGDDSTRPSQL